MKNVNKGDFVFYDLVQQGYKPYRLASDKQGNLLEFISMPFGIGGRAAIKARIPNDPTTIKDYIIGSEIRIITVEPVACCPSSDPIGMEFENVKYIPFGQPHLYLKVTLEKWS